MDFRSYNWDEMFEYLTQKQKRILAKGKKEKGMFYRVPYFKPNMIINIPDSIVKLKSLEVIYLMNAYTTKATLAKLEKLLPNTVILPASKYFGEDN